MSKPNATVLPAKRREGGSDRATALQQLVAMIHFDFDKADILSDDVSNLDRKAAIMQANPGVRSG